MKFKGTIIGEASGSLSSMTFSHNRGGQYIRQRAVPTNPNSTYQQVVRSLVSSLSGLWSSGISATDRDAWDVYAAQVPIADALGEPRNVGGLGMYIRGNVGRLQSGVAGLTRVDPGPTVYNLGEYSAPVIGTINAISGLMSLAFTNTDEWANEDGSAMLVYASRPQNPGINFFKGPYRYAGAIEGDGTTPPTSPASITLPFAVTAGSKVFVRAVVSRADGRLSATFQGTGLAS